ncbi:MAG: c-type cytochrome [Deltaproteobacteria bacterium]|nr:c-type cytochrome [Deltaproteobacteria bacterium]
MKTFLKVVIFSVLAIEAFSLYANYGIPNVKPAPPPVEEKLDLGAMTMDTFIALGEKIYKGKGTCTLCHNELGRAPMINKVAAIAEERMKDARYKGEAKSSEAYVMESLIKPSAFVVAGFGKAGTNDTVSPMPDVSSGSIGLSDAEVKAVIAYLQDSAGVDVTVEIPTDAPAEEEGEEETVRVALKTPEEIVEKFGCGMCHKIAGHLGDIAPDLTKIGASVDSNYLRRAILDPNADIAKGFEPDMMPPDLGEQMAASELEILVKYMASQK